MLKQRVSPQSAFAFNATAGNAPRAERWRHAGTAEIGKIE
jgi:hypothetical protein